MLLILSITNYQEPNNYVNGGFDIVKNNKITNQTTEHIKNKIEPALKRKKVVICDRFIDSTIAYQVYGKKVKKTLTGFMSRLFQHELDHLNGVLMVENKKIKGIYQRI